MFTKILCPLDHSDHSAKALRTAIDLAKQNEAGLYLLHVLHRDLNIKDLQKFGEVEHLAEHVQQETMRLKAVDARIDLGTGSAFQDPGVSPRLLAEVGQHILDDARGDAVDSGLKNVTTRLMDGNPANRILECIDEEGIDCVVMGSRGLSDLKGLFLGSVSHKVASRAPCTCIMVK